MAVIYVPGSALAGLRQDLGSHAGRWWEEYGIGPTSKHVALQCTVPVTTNRKGQIQIPRKDWVKDKALKNQRYKRLPYEETPRGRHGSLMTINVNPAQYGQAEEWDDTDDFVRVILEDPARGLGTVEEYFLEIALNRLAQGATYDFLNLLSADATVFEDADGAALADVDASSKPWSDPSDSTPIAHFRSARKLVGRKLNAALMTFGTFEDLMASAELTGRYGGNVGAGPLNEELRQRAVASLGLEHVFIADDDTLDTDGDGTADEGTLGLTGSTSTPSAGRYVIHFEWQPGEAQKGLFGRPCTFYRFQIPLPGSNEQGIAVSTRDAPLNHNGHEVYPSAQWDWVFDPTMGARIDFGAPA